MGRVELGRGWGILSKVSPVLMIDPLNLTTAWFVFKDCRDIFQIVQLFHLASFNSYTLNNYWGFDHFSPSPTHLHDRQMLIRTCTMP